MPLQKHVSFAFGKDRKSGSYHARLEAFKKR